MTTVNPGFTAPTARRNWHHKKAGSNDHGLSSLNVKPVGFPDMIQAHTLPGLPIKKTELPVGAEPGEFNLCGVATGLPHSYPTTAYQRLYTAVKCYCLRQCLPSRWSDAQLPS
jgi:hypothetical protein